MSITILTSDFFQKNCKPDLDVTPNYGVIKLPIEQADLVTAIMELSSGVGTKEEAKVNYNEKTNMTRKVDMWRIPMSSKIADMFHKYAVELNKIFNYKVSGIQDIQYLEYSVGDFYKTHTDINCEFGSTRKISISWVLNEDFTGGELKIMSGGEEVTLSNTTDELIGFTSFMNHSVQPVTSGTRKVLVCWINGESWR
jgi:predicted 2-oxoglutarate/Fe(II)-dependent dioxygenase YbiX